MRVHGKCPAWMTSRDRLEAAEGDRGTGDRQTTPHRENPWVLRLKCRSCTLCGLCVKGGVCVHVCKRKRWPDVSSWSTARNSWRQDLAQVHCPSAKPWYSSMAQVSPTSPRTAQGLHRQLSPPPPVSHPTGARDPLPNHTQSLRLLAPRAWHFLEAPTSTSPGVYDLAQTTINEQLQAALSG